MEFDNIPDAFLSKLRLTILSALLTGQKTFPELKKITGATDGNISAQAAKLEENEFLTVEKKFIGKKPATIYSITEYGREQFREYVDLLERVVLTKIQNDKETKKCDENEGDDRSYNDVCVIATQI